ncbi:MAG TPA: DUF6596 domain-containing protein [Thermoanaerobaculia bacterium]|nr:DUF6596 domain-containing protein [Thermoanaerobaculia bacterium]
MTDETHGLVDHLFRRKAGEMVAALTRLFGPERIELAEEVVQEAMVSALGSWPFHGIPENPGGWLLAVAKNRALDRLRRESAFRRKVPLLDRGEREVPAAALFEWEPRDDQLRMMFICCHPEIPTESRVALTLRAVGGFSVEEIARALLARAEAVAQRIVRAKRTIRERKLPLEMPATRALLDERLDSVLEVLYLMFNEGYTAGGGDDLVREEVCLEAIRLGELLASSPATRRRRVHALLALLLLQSSRFRARRNEDGRMLVLSEQDRGRWDRERIARGFHHFEESIGGRELSRFHVEAAIAAVHAGAESFERTDWRRVIELYDELLAIRPSPIAALNRSVAVAKLEGAKAGLDALESVANDPRLRDYALLPALQGDYWLELGDRPRAAAAFERALTMPMSSPEKDFLREKLERLRRERRDE